MKAPTDHQRKKITNTSVQPDPDGTQDQQRCDSKAPPVWRGCIFGDCIGNVLRGFLDDVMSGYQSPPAEIPMKPIAKILCIEGDALKPPS